MSFDAPDTPSIPKLAAGGIVTCRTVALVGERGPQAVIPLGSRFSASSGDSYTINVHGSILMEDELLQRIRTGISRIRVTNGLSPI